MNDQKGELLISCNNLITSKSEEEWFSTGEMVKKDEHGYIYIMDNKMTNHFGGVKDANEVC